MFRRALACLVLLIAAPAAAQTFPKFTGYVVDAADVLPPQVEADLTAKLDGLFRDTHRQLVVATVPNLQGYPIEDYGNALLRQWGVGLKNVNTGAILLVAPTERKVRVEVGYGLEPILTDAFSGTVIREQIVPRFKAGDLPGGVVAGTDALADQLRAAPEEAKARTDAAAAEYDRQRQSRTNGDGGVPVTLIFWGVVFLFFVLPALTRGSRRRGRRWGGGGSNWPIVLWSVANELNRGSRGGGWGGGSWGGSGGSWGGGGGFGGGGGGSGGGGGASGSW